MTAPEREALVKARPYVISTAEMQTYSETGYRLTQKAKELLGEIDAVLSAPAVTVTEEWKPIETAPKGRKIIGGYFNELGNWRSVMARYYLPKTLEWNSDYDGGDEDGFAPEGWYEEIENSDTVYPMREPTHWQHLPAALKSTTPQTGSQE